MTEEHYLDYKIYHKDVLAKYFDDFLQSSLDSTYESLKKLCLNPESLFMDINKAFSINYFQKTYFLKE